MLKQGELLLKVLCVVLALLGISRLSRLISHANPLGGATIPQVPEWSPPAVTNAPAAGSSRVHAGPGQAPVRFPPGMPMPGRPGPGAGGPPLDPELQRRLDRIVQSGFLGPVIKPPPMALLGIAGDRVLLRAPNGQTGLVKEGEELGGVRLIRIGTNRVIVEEEAQEKELMLFGGIGGESLMRQGTQAKP